MAQRDDIEDTPFYSFGKRFQEEKPSRDISDTLLRDARDEAGKHGTFTVVQSTPSRKFRSKSGKSIGGKPVHQNNRAVYRHTNLTMNPHQAHTQNMRLEQLVIDRAKLL